ncbi:T-cell receptor alpha chain V region HPB-MLT [Fukomys damarensis]|nr:T-cell receptor alpha chain V region HPB-MLT [Fukomys damarensis]
MILVIRQEAYKQQNATEDRFSVNFQKAAKSFSLKISDSELGDTATYFCALMEHTVRHTLGISVTQTIIQSQPEISVQEAATATLGCTYDTTENNYHLSWYKQPPDGQMILIIRQEAYKQQNATEDRFSVNFHKAAKSFRLKISDSELGDTATYFCAFATLTVMQEPKRG